MIYNIKLNLSVDLIGLSEKQLLEIQQTVMMSMIENKKLDFKIIDKLFTISPRPYFCTSLEDVKLDNEPTIKEIYIDISG